MSVEWLVAAFLLAELALVCGRVALVAGWIEPETGLVVEWLASLALVLALFALGLRPLGAWGALLLALAGTVGQLLASALVPRLFALAIGWGEEDEPLPIEYPPAAGALLLLVALPLALPGLLAGIVHVYAFYLVAAVVAYAVFLVVESLYPDEYLGPLVLYLLAAVLAGAFFLLAAGRVGPARALVASGLVSGLGAGLLVALPFFAARLFALDEFDALEAPRRAGIAFGVSAAAVGVLWASRVWLS